MTTQSSLMRKPRRFALSLPAAVVIKKLPFGLMAAIAFVFLTIFLAFFGNYFAPFTPDQSDFTAILTPPAWESGDLSHFLGTDQLGRDVLSRLFSGTRIAIGIAVATSLIAAVIGVTIGLICGYFGGWVDVALSRIIDAFLALPFILLALALISALGVGFWNILLVLVLTNWAQYARVVRAEVLTLKGRPFVTLAQMTALPSWRIILRHILPNAMVSILVLAILDIGRAIILESTLSFLGLGIQPPSVSWGLMLADGRAYLALAWWLTVFPGVMIVLTVLSFNAIGQAARDWLDPRESK
jgi:peptide/nickel transport system permease protein